MNIAFIGSGSKGNCTYININDNHILIDVGLSMKKINYGLLSEYGIDLSDINIVIITHAHTDHIGSLKSIIKNFPNIKYMVPKKIQENIIEKAKVHIPQERQIPIERSVVGKTMVVYAYEINHDVPCFAYKIIDKMNNESYLHISDNGGIKKKELKELFKGCTYYAIESNHDLTLQILDPTRHEGLKRRVLGYYGHTHNAEAMDLAFNLATGETKGIIFHHLSEECNTEELAKDTHDNLLGIWGERTKFKEIKIRYARQDEVVILA